MINIFFGNIFCLRGMVSTLHTNETCCHYHVVLQANIHLQDSTALPMLHAGTLSVSIVVSQDSVLDLAVIMGGCRRMRSQGLEDRAPRRQRHQRQGSSPAGTVCVTYPVSRECSKCRALKGTCWHDNMMLQENAKSRCR